jgi:ubiquinone/menaquinone biosynthesis C-methylase UbiE
MLIPESESLDRCHEVYRGEAEAYDRLISAEDCEGRLLPALMDIAPLEGRSVLDVGAGTGRLARLVAPHCARLVAAEREPHMLARARGHLETMGAANASCAVADARALPLLGAAFDVVTAGWVFGHFTFWTHDAWRENATRAIVEMQRVTRMGGTLVIFETMGTAVTEPAPPAPGLAAYYAWLEGEMGFERRLIQTDFEFESVEASAETCGFFFGQPYAELIRANRWARVPEWTGMWWRQA